MPSFSISIVKLTEGWAYNTILTIIIIIIVVIVIYSMDNMSTF